LSPAFAKNDPIALLQAAAVKLRSAHSMNATVTVRTSFPPMKGETQRSVGYETTKIEQMRPNLSFAHIWFSPKGRPSLHEHPEMAILSTGKSVYVIKRGTYKVHPLDKDMLWISNTAEELNPFIHDAEAPIQVVKTARKANTLKYIRIAPNEKWSGKTYRVVEFEYANKMFPHDPVARLVIHQKCYIGGDGLIHRTVMDNSLGIYSEYTLEEMRIDPRISKNDFILPKDVKPEMPPLPLLANGVTAPDFSVTDAHGKATTLRAFRGKPIVIDLWATWCIPCQQSMPIVKRIAEKYSGRGLIVLSINVWDEKQAFEKWVTQHPEYAVFKILRDPSEGDRRGKVTRLYHVSGIPTLFVIDRSGAISANSVGMDDDGSALEKAVEKIL